MLGQLDSAMLDKLLNNQLQNMSFSCVLDIAIESATLQNISIFFKHIAEKINVSTNINEDDQCRFIALLYMLLDYNRTQEVKAIKLAL